MSERKKDKETEKKEEGCCGHGGGHSHHHSGEDHHEHHHAKPGETVCLNCGAGENERVLLRVLHKGEKGYVCVRCLPQFIHGSH